MIEDILAAPRLIEKKFPNVKMPKNGYIWTPKGIVRELDQKMMFFDDFQSCLKYDKQYLGYVKLFSGPNNGDYTAPKYFYMLCKFFQTLRTT